MKLPFALRILRICGNVVLTSPRMTCQHHLHPQVAGELIIVTAQDMPSNYVWLVANLGTQMLQRLPCFEINPDDNKKEIKNI